MKDKTPLQQYEYRAYGSDFKIVEGQEQASNFTNLALILRQRGLQIIEANVLTANDTAGRRRLEKMKSRMAVPNEDTNPRQAIHSWLSALIHLLRKG